MNEYILTDKDIEEVTKKVMVGIATIATLGIGRISAYKEVIEGAIKSVARKKKPNE